MTTGWLPYAVLRAASLLAPGDQRRGWMKEWRSELWYVPRHEAMGFCLGAFRDALWMRRCSPASAHQRSALESPIHCLAFLAALAAASCIVTLWLPAPWMMGRSGHLRAADLAAGSVIMLGLSCVLSAVTRLMMGRAPGGRRPIAWGARLRRGTFLAFKVALVQPILFCGLVVLLVVGHVVPVGPQFVIFAGWFLTFRWVIEDQRRRCPVCLRLLDQPVRIGTPSKTFLEWYGAETVCIRGHGLMHIPETSASYSGEPQWLRLDSSWSGLFSEPVGAPER